MGGIRMYFRHSHAMNKPIIIIIVFVALTALVTWQYFMPVFDKVSSLREDLKAWQGKLDDTQALSRKLESLKKKYDTMSDEIERVSQAVPAGEDTPGLLVQLEQLASQNGLILNNVSFAVQDTKKAKKTTVVTGEGPLPVSSTGTASGALPTAQKSAMPAGVKIMTVDLSLSGAQNSFKAFLSALEDNLRIMDVTTIDFAGKGSSSEVGTSSGSSSQDFKISLDTYFR